MARRPWSLPTSVYAGRPAAHANTRAARLSGDRARLALVLLIALCQGLLYLCLLPPWQHYDEPTHFEYAWLIANRPGLPALGSEDQVMRRDLAAAMIEHGFFQGAPAPRLLTDQRPIEVGITELGHPPTYYLLVSLPLRLVRHLDLVSQLYVARAISFGLFLLTVATAALLVRDLTPAGHDLRWAVPLAIALTPPFADLMTAVNNDAGVVAVATLFLWGAVRLIRFGPTWPRVAWLCSAALLAVITKNTGAITLALAPLACLIGLWVKRGWRWRWLALVTVSGGAALLIGVLGWGDAAYWYRGNQATVQEEPTRVARPDAPLGSYALALTTPAGGGLRSAIGPLVGVNMQQLGGSTATVGGWFWSDDPAAAVEAGVAYRTPDMPAASSMTRRIRLTTTPAFMSWTVILPKNTNLLQYLVVVSTPPGTAAPAHLFLDGAVVVGDRFSASDRPIFDDSTAQTGSWSGRQFTNLLRNASAELAWPRLRPWVDQALITYIHRSPSQTVATLFDIGRIEWVIVPYMLRPAIDSFTLMFAWSNVKITSPIWRYLSYGVALLALIGCLRWAFSREHARQGSGDGRRLAIIFLALAGLLAWMNTILRPLPLLGEGYVVPTARYTFPAIAATMLVVVGGCWSLVPRRHRLAALLVLLGGMLVLNSVAVATIWSYYQPAG